VRLIKRLDAGCMRLEEACKVTPEGPVSGGGSQERRKIGGLKNS
jgi:hypothetical protein